METKILVFEEVYDPDVKQVWHAITNKFSMKKWYFDIPDFELKEGSVFNFFEPGNDNKFHHQCKILEIVPFRKLQHSWTYPELSKGKSILTWNLSSLDNHTKVRLTHEGVETFADGGLDFKIENYEAGWNELLGINLKNFLKNNL